MSEIKTHPEHGWPIIPSRGNRSLQECKDIIRAYVTATYREWNRFKFYLRFTIAQQVNILTTRLLWLLGSYFPRT